MAQIQERAAALLRLRLSPTSDVLWETLPLFEGETFFTATGLGFTYTIRGNELFVSRKEKSITRATVDIAFQNALALGEEVTGPKKLGCFGASYLYPVFIALGVVKPKQDSFQPSFL